MRLRRRKRNNWLREKTIAIINEEHNGLFEKEKESLCHKFISYLLGKKGWWVVIMLISLFLIFISPINIEFLNIIDIKYETAKELVNQRTSDLAAIFSIALVVVGFLLSSLAIKHSISYKLLFKNAKIYFVSYYCLSLIAALIVLSSLRDSIDNVIFTKVFLAISYLVLYGLFLIGKLFKNIIGMTSEYEVYKLICRGSIEEAHNYVNNKILTEESKKIYNSIIEKYNIQNYSSYLDNSKETFVYNVNLKELEKIIKETYHKRRDSRIPILFINNKINKNSIKLYNNKIYKTIVFKRKEKKEYENILRFINNKIEIAAVENNTYVLELLLNNYSNIYNIHAPFNLNSDIVFDKINKIILNINKKAYENNNFESIRIIDDTNYKMINFSLKSKNISLFQAYLDNNYKKYEFFYSHNKEHTIKSSSLYVYSINEIIYNFVSIINKINSFHVDSQKEYIKYIITTYVLFEELLYNVVNNRDIDSFIIAINKYSQIEKKNNLKSREILSEISKIELLQDVEKKIKLKKLKNNYKILNQSISLWKYGILGIKYWLYLLFDRKVFTKEQLSEYIKEIENHFNFNELKCSLDELLMLYNSFYNHFNWRFWNPNKDIPDDNCPPKEWMIKGIIIDKLINKDLTFFINKLHKVEDLKYISFLYEKVSEIINNIDLNFIKIFKDETKKQFEANKKELLSNLENLKNYRKKHEFKKIANSNLDNEKINQFRNEVGEAWYQDLFIRNIFREQNLIEELKIKNTKYVGIHQYFDDLKCNFIDNEFYREIGGLGNIGYSIAKNEDQYFFNNLLDTRNNFIERDSLKEIIDTAINRLEECNKTTDLIFVPYTFYYTDENFEEDVNFIENNAKNSDGNIISEIKEGEYKGIPIILMNNNQLQNTVVVCDFSSAFKMKIKTKDDWYKKYFNIEVRELEDDEANNLYNENPNKWKKLDEKTELNREEAILRIKNNVVIKAYTNILFEVVDEDAFVLGKLINKSI